MFKKQESIEILKVLDFYSNIEEYKKKYNHARRKHKSRIKKKKKE